MACFGIVNTGKNMLEWSQDKIMKKARFLKHCALAAIALLTACQQSPYPIFFLMEEGHDATGMTSKQVVRYRNHTYRKLPLINHEHIEKFRSFLDMKGGYGVVFTLKREWRNRLMSDTTNKRGHFILPLVAGYAFQPVRIDAPINDGQLVIWSGLNGYDLKEIARTIKPENPELEKKRFKSTNPRSKPELDAEQQNHAQQKDHTGRTIGEIHSSAS